jgi:hypothetical protein
MYKNTFSSSCGLFAAIKVRISPALCVLGARNELAFLEDLTRVTDPRRLAAPAFTPLRHTRLLHVYTLKRPAEDQQCRSADAAVTALIKVGHHGGGAAVTVCRLGCSGTAAANGVTLVDWLLLQRSWAACNLASEKLGQPTGPGPGWPSGQPLVLPAK